MSAAPGVSVVVCTFNGAARLPATLAHLAAQRVPPGLAWEVLVVDNASADDSAELARASWSERAPAPLRVLREPTPGVGYARMLGLDEARYEAVSFVDDDNWVAADWVATVWDVLASDPGLGGCGGDSEAVTECEPPAWFRRFQGYWAIGRQGDGADRDVGQLWGAGFAVRKLAWEALRADGFALTLPGRMGTSLVSGEDLELCAALRLAGWRLGYDPRLRLRHFLPRARLTWDYAKRLCRGWGVATGAFDPYLLASTPPGVHAWLLRRWTWRLAAVSARLLGQTARAAWSGEGSEAVLRRETLRGRLQGLLAARGTWAAAYRRVRDAAWRRAPR